MVDMFLLNKEKNRFQDNNKWIIFKGFLPISGIMITWNEIWFLLLKRNTYKNLISCKIIFMEPIGAMKKKNLIDKIIKLMHQNAKA